MNVGKQQRRAALVGAVCLTTVAISNRAARAANYTWDPQSTGTGSDGAGTWDTTTPIWSHSAADTTWLNDGSATAVFGSGGTAGIVTLGANIDAGGLTFNTTGYTIAEDGADADSLSLSGTVALGGATSTISAYLAGAGNIGVVNTAPSALRTLVLSGSNSMGYTGTVTVDPGAVLSMSSAAAVPANIAGVSSASAIPVIGFNYAVSTGTTGSTTDPYAPTVAGAAGSTGVIAVATSSANSNANINLATEGGGGWYAGTSTTSSGYTYYGIITPAPVSATDTTDYVYRLGGGGGTGQFSMSNAASLYMPAGSNSTSVIVGDNAVGGNGTVELNRNFNASYNGSTTINAGSQITLDNTSANVENPIGSGTSGSNILPTTALIMNGGTLANLSGTNHSTGQTFSGVTLNAGAATFSNINAGFTLAMNGITRNTGSTANFTVTGPVTTTTANANFSGGQQTILGGYATVGGTSWAVSGSGATAGAITALPTASYSTSFVAGTDVDAPAGASTPDSTPGSPITINSLRFNNAGAYNLNDSGSGDTLTIATGGILETTGVGANTVEISTANLTSGNGQDLIVTQNNTAANPMIIDSMISGSNGLTKSGPGALTLTAANIFSGVTTINAGTLTLGNSLALQNSTVSSNVFGSTLNTAGGTLSFGTLNSATLGGLTGNHALSLTNSASGPVALSVGNNNQSTTYGGNMSGTGSLVKTGTGTLILSNSNSYSGGTEVSSGTLSVTGSLTGAGALSVDDDATLNGTGVISAMVNVYGFSLASGTIFPGTTIDTPGETASTLTVGSGSRLLGTTELDITGADTTDSIIFGDGVTSSVTFGGTLTVNDPNSTAYAAGQTYDLFSFGSATGMFNSINLPALPAGDSWNTSALYTSGVISVSAVPEPASAFLLGGLAALQLRRRRGAVR